MYKKLVGFFTYNRSYKKICKNIYISRLNFMLKINPRRTMSSHYINIFIRKSHTFNVERMNCLIRHYLARFVSKTYRWSKS